MHADLLCLTGHTQPVQALAFPSHGRWLLSGSADRTLVFWEPATAKVLRRVSEHSAQVWGVALSPDGRRMASVAGSASCQGELIVWQLADGSVPEARKGSPVLGMGERAAVAFHPTRPVLAVATGAHDSVPGCVLLLDERGKEAWRWPGAADTACVALAWSPDGRRLAASFVPFGRPGAQAEVVLFDADRREAIHHLR